LSTNTDSQPNTNCHCEESFQYGKDDVAISAKLRHHRSSAHFRELFERATGFLHTSMHLCMKRTTAATEHMVTSQVNSCWDRNRRHSPCTSNHPTDRKTAPTPRGMEIVRTESKNILQHFPTPLSAICLNSNGVKPINAAAPTVTAIIKSFVYPHIPFHLLFLLGKCLVARLEFYGSLRAKRHPSPTTRPTTNGAAKSHKLQLHNARSPIATITAPQPKTHQPNLRVFQSLCQLLPLNITFTPKANIAIAGADCFNASIITCGTHIFVTSLVANHSTSLELVEGEFKRGAAPLRALYTLSLDGRGSG